MPDAAVAGGDDEKRRQALERLEHAWEAEAEAKAEYESLLATLRAVQNDCGRAQSKLCARRDAVLNRKLELARLCQLAGPA